MKQLVVHWVFRGKAKCRTPGSTLRVQTSNKAKVTCGNCKRAKGFKRKVKKSSQVVRRAYKENKCDHDFKYYGHQGAALVFRCSKCKEELKRLQKKTEREFLEEHHARSVAMHQFHHLFRAKFWDSDKNRWKLEGNDLMDAVETWAKQQPKGYVRIASVDDQKHMSALAVLIESKTDAQYFGTTVYIIGQAQPPFQFFLYPGHRTELQFALAGIALEQEKSYFNIEMAAKEFHLELESWQP